MTPTREHLAGLELAFKQINSDGGFDDDSLLRLITEAQSAPEPVQGEALRVVGVRISTDGFGSYIADSAMGIGAAQPGEVREPLMTVAQHNRIMAAAKPDAELVELLRMVRNEWHCVPRDYSQLERIDAKLAAYRT